MFDILVESAPGAGIGGVEVVVDVDNLHRDLTGLFEREGLGRVDQNKQTRLGADFCCFGQSARFLGLRLRAVADIRVKPFAQFLEIKPVGVQTIAVEFLFQGDGEISRVEGCISMKPENAAC